MKTIKIITTLTLFFIIASQLKAQDTTKPFYFPHKTGDMWEYFYSEVPYADTLQNFTIFDSTDSNGIIHIRQHARFINPIEPPVILSDTTIYWIDNINYNVFTTRPMIDTALVYKLNGAKGEKWIIKTIQDSNGIHGYEMARITDKWQGSKFGRNTSFMEILFYRAIDSHDTDGYSVYGSDLIADGFGVISKGAGELAGQINLIGAVINGTLYGDTTLVSVKDKKNLLPSTIKLYQNYPNPFNPNTVITYSLPSASNVKLLVYNTIGQSIKVLEDYYKNAGNYSVNFNASDLPSGIYFYELKAGKFTQIMKMLLIK